MAPSGDRPLSKLSVAEIRARYASGARPVTAQLLARLRRDRRAGVRALHDTLRKRHDRDRAERLRLERMLDFERVLWRSGLERVAGVDEAGVGPLAGPVVAAAVVVPPGTELVGLDDSKRLDAAARAAAWEAIHETATSVGVGIAEVEEIDRLNVLQASLLAMRRAVQALDEAPQHVLVDAREIPDLPCPQNRFDKGDGLDFSIAAASIVAKVHRDRLMAELDSRWPEYGFARHAGYATPEHQAAIRRHGPCPIHRAYGFLEELQGGYSSAFYELKEGLDSARPSYRKLFPGR